jgi:hypothetical protein
MAEAVLSDDLTALKNLLAQQDQRRRQAELEQARRIVRARAQSLCIIDETLTTLLHHSNNSTTIRSISKRSEPSRRR